MKMILALALGTLSLASSAHLIVGTPVLKGTLKTKVNVKGIESTCKVKIDKIKNLMEEDSFGNPAYKIFVDVSLDGHDYNSGLSVRLNQSVVLTNLFQDGAGTIVKDYEYVSEGYYLRISEDGRLKSLNIPFESRSITCSF